jgi:hypothetical protein
MNASSWSASTLEEPTFDWSQLAARMPPKDTCDELYRLFLSDIHPLIPILHVPTFHDKYNRFWNGPWRHANYEELIAFQPLLHAVLFGGAVGRSTHCDWSSPFAPKNRQLSATFLKLATEALSTLDFPNCATIESLQAFLLVHTLQIQEDQSLSSCSFVAIAFRASQSLGLHKDGAQFGLDTVQIEVRRRIWCHVLHLDVVTSLISGLPPISSEDSFKPIADLKDGYITYSPESQTQGVNWLPEYLLAVGRYDISWCIRQLLSALSSAQISNFDDAKPLLDLVDKLAAKCNMRLELSAAFRGSRDVVKSELAQQLNPFDQQFEAYRGENVEVWNENLLRLLVAKAFCLLYQALMHDEAIWSQVRPQ